MAKVGQRRPPSGLARYVGCGVTRGTLNVARMHQMLGCAAAHALLLLVPFPGALAGPSHVDPAVGSALRALSQPVNDVRVLSRPEVRELFERAGGGVPPAGLIAFRLKGDSTTYINAASEVYRDAAHRPSPFHLLRLAATLLHERMHDTHGEDEAYRRQADFVRSRLDSLPRTEWKRAHAYWRTLEVRAISMARAMRRRPT